eukprot:TRINITY_DN15545_c1_g1_i2.p1 TRINITY_DN15545_c1_g1~~TRINITY_DN15545_c1_g1_i2.p1  ORF type:complete len:231 (+),score=18.00 TRINITY_DN15545_c1_g1_i2:93-695(+)
MQAKLSDFNLVKWGEGSSLHSTDLVGSPGYLDPAYSISHKAIPSVDVYSFGIVAMRVVSGRGVVIETLLGNALSIREWVAGHNDSGTIDTVTDPLLLQNPSASATSHLHQVVLQIAQLALRCTAMLPGKRPSMGQIVRELEGLQYNESGGKLVNKKHLEVIDRIVQAALEPKPCLEDELRLISPMQLDDPNHSNGSTQDP